ncbi:hypothetical protein K435DRAFT_922349, partial [Dendrothele bispora CBS 962.96]
GFHTSDARSTSSNLESHHSPHNSCPNCSSYHCKSDDENFLRAMEEGRSDYRHRLEWMWYCISKAAPRAAWWDYEPVWCTLVESDDIWSIWENGDDLSLPVAPTSGMRVKYPRNPSSVNCEIPSLIPKWWNMLPELVKDNLIIDNHSWDRFRVEQRRRGHTCMEDLSEEKMWSTWITVQALIGTSIHYILNNLLGNCNLADLNLSNPMYWHCDLDLQESLLNQATLHKVDEWLTDIWSTSNNGYDNSDLRNHVGKTLDHIPYGLEMYLNYNEEDLKPHWTETQTAISRISHSESSVGTESDSVEPASWVSAVVLFTLAKIYGLGPLTTEHFVDTIKYTFLLGPMQSLADKDKKRRVKRLIIKVNYPRYQRMLYGYGSLPLYDEDLKMLTKKLSSLSVNMALLDQGGKISLGFNSDNEYSEDEDEDEDEEDTQVSDIEDPEEEYTQASSPSMPEPESLVQLPGPASNHENNALNFEHLETQNVTEGQTLLDPHYLPLSYTVDTSPNQVQPLMSSPSGTDYTQSYSTTIESTDLFTMANFNPQENGHLFTFQGSGNSSQHREQIDDIFNGSASGKIPLGHGTQTPVVQPLENTPFIAETGTSHSTNTTGKIDYSGQGNFKNISQWDPADTSYDQHVGQNEVAQCTVFILAQYAVVPPALRHQANVPKMWTRPPKPPRVDKIRIEIKKQLISMLVYLKKNVRRSKSQGVNFPGETSSKFSKSTNASSKIGQQVLLSLDPSGSGSGNKWSRDEQGSDIEERENNQRRLEI